MASLAVETCRSVRMQNGAFSWVSYSASAAAIFIGCCSTMILAWVSPVHMTSRPATIATMAPSLRVERIVVDALALHDQPEADAGEHERRTTRNADAMTCAKVADGRVLEEHRAEVGQLGRAWSPG